MQNQIAEKTVSLHFSKATCPNNEATAFCTIFSIFSLR
jgi:hypothetical protein